MTMWRQRICDIETHILAGSFFLYYIVSIILAYIVYTLEWIHAKVHRLKLKSKTVQNQNLTEGSAKYRIYLPDKTVLKKHYMLFHIVVLREYLFCL